MVVALGVVAVVLREPAEDPTRFRGRLPASGEPQPYRVRLTEPASLRAVLAPDDRAPLDLLVAVDPDHADATRNALDATTTVPTDLGGEPGGEGVVVAAAGPDADGAARLILPDLPVGTYRFVVLAGDGWDGEPASFDLRVEVIPSESPP